MKRLISVCLILLATCLPALAQRPLKQSTAVVVPVGAFVDSTGAALPSLTIASIDITTYKNATAGNITPAATGTDNDMVHNDDGTYTLELTATDTDTLGNLRLTFAISGALIFHEDFVVLPANVYDSFYGADLLAVDAREISSDSGAADNLEAAYDGTGYAGGTIKQVVDAAASVYDAARASYDAEDSFGEFLNIVFSEVSAIKAKTDNLPSDPADDSDLDAALAAIAAYIDTEVAAIKAKTDNLPSDPADDSDIDTALAAIAAYIDTEVAAIKAKTDNLPSDPADASVIATAFGNLLQIGSSYIFTNDDTSEAATVTITEE